MKAPRCPLQKRSSHSFQASVHSRLELYTSLGSISISRSRSNLWEASGLLFVARSAGADDCRIGSAEMHSAIKHRLIAEDFQNLDRNPTDLLTRNTTELNSANSTANRCEVLHSAYGRDLHRRFSALNFQGHSVLKQHPHLGALTFVGARRDGPGQGLILPVHMFAPQFPQAPGAITRNKAAVTLDLATVPVSAWTKACGPCFCEFLKRRQQSDNNSKMPAHFSA